MGSAEYAALREAVIAADGTEENPVGIEISLITASAATFFPEEKQKLVENSL